MTLVARLHLELDRPVKQLPLKFTTAKLAAGAVSYSSLADGTVALIANQVTDTRTIVGSVTLSGLKPIARGSGFSARPIS